MLHATIHAASADANLTTMQRADLRPLSISFEEVAAALEQLPRMYFEPDGSFVWVAPTGETPWQLEGQLQDRGDCLDHVEIKGTCAPAAFETFLSALRREGDRLVFHLLPDDRFIDEATAAQLARP